jgi:hypothetical protein
MRELELGFLVDPFQKHGRRDSEGSGDPEDVDKRNVPLAALNSADVGAVKLREFGQLLL